MLHILFKDFSPSVSLDPIPIVLLDAFCSFISPYSSHTPNYLPIAKTIFSQWEWTRHSHQCSSIPGVNKSGLSDFSPAPFACLATQHRPLSLVLCPFSCPFRGWGNAFSQHFSSPRCHPACFSLLSGVSHARDLVFTSWLPGKV